MLETLQWLQANWMLLAGSAGAAVMGASLVVKAIAPWTKTKADDKAADWLSKVHKWLSKLALNPK